MIVFSTCFLLAILLEITGEKTQVCEAWSKVEQDIKQKYNKVSCLKNELCSGINCSGVINGDEFHSGIQVNACEVPASFVLYLNVPKLGINNWHRTFSHADTFNISDGVKGEISVTKVKNGLSVGLKMEINVPGSRYFPNVKTPLSIPIIQGVSIPVPACQQQSSSPYVNNRPIDLNTEIENVVSLTNVSKINSDATDLHSDGNCTINNYTCPRYEMCQQLKNSSPIGICICLSEYRRNVFGECAIFPSTPTSSGSLQKNDSSMAKPSDRGSSRSFLVVAILVPVSCILCFVIITYAVIRLRICRYLRRRLRVQVYEQVLLSQDEENDEQVADPNPVV